MTMLVLAVDQHPQFPAHKVVTVRALADCHHIYPGFSRRPEFKIRAGDKATTTVTHDTFRGVKKGDHLPCDHFAYYAAA